MIRIQKATENDLCRIYQMQVEAFLPLLDKYEDYATSPAAEPFERTLQRFAFDNVAYHLIMLDDEPIGAIRVRRQDTTYVLAQILITPKHQNKGYAQEYTGNRKAVSRRNEMDPGHHSPGREALLPV